MLGLTLGFSSHADLCTDIVKVGAQSLSGAWLLVDREVFVRIGQVPDLGINGADLREGGKGVPAMHGAMSCLGRRKDISWGNFFNS